jgi:ribose-phosphate pyrophosphokinase
MLVFALEGSEHLGSTLAECLGSELARHEERHFEDGEHKARPLVSVRGEDVFVLARLAGGGAGSPNDQLVKLLFFLATCRANGAGRVTAVLPYLAYARKDRQTKRRDPVGTRTLAALLEAAGTDRVVAVDVHNPAAFQNAFRCETIHLEARQVFVPRLRELAAGAPAAVVSPDGGGIKRADLLRRSLEAATGEEVRFAFMEKHRSRGIVSGDLFAGDVEGARAFVVDDIIATGGTMRRAAAACREHGAASVHLVATHGLFGPGSEALLADASIDSILITDSLAQTAQPPGPSVKVVSIAPLLADAIGRLAQGEPLGDLTGLEDQPSAASASAR